MHPTICYQLANAQTADLHQQAARERAARPAVRARHARPRHATRPAPGHTVTRLARRALTLADGRGPSPAR